MTRQSSRNSRLFHKAGEIAAVSGLYVLAAQVGLLTGVERDMPLLIWPASGIAAAAVILLGNGGVVGWRVSGHPGALQRLPPAAHQRAGGSLCRNFASLQALLVVRLAARWIGPFPKEPPFRIFCGFLPWQP